MAECRFDEWSTEHPFSVDCREHGKSPALCSIGQHDIELQWMSGIRDCVEAKAQLESSLHERDAACAKMREALDAWMFQIVHQDRREDYEYINFMRSDDYDKLRAQSHEALSSDAGLTFLDDHDRLAERVKKAETKSQEKMSTMIESTSLDRAYVDGWNSAMEAIQETLAEAEETR